MNKVQLDASKIRVNEDKPTGDDKESQQFVELMPWDQEGCKTRMEEINKFVKDVSGRDYPDEARTLPFSRRFSCQSKRI